MLVRTRTVLPRPAESVWPLLCDSRVTLTPRCPVFRVVVPRPVECRLPEGSVAREPAGSVCPVSGACAYVQGSIRRRLTEWGPPQGGRSTWNTPAWCSPAVPTAHRCRTPSLDVRAQRLPGEGAPAGTSLSLCSQSATTGDRLRRQEKLQHHLTLHL